MLFFLFAADVPGMTNKFNNDNIKDKVKYQFDFNVQMVYTCPTNGIFQILKILSHDQQHAYDPLPNWFCTLQSGPRRELKDIFSYLSYQAKWWSHKATTIAITYIIQTQPPYICSATHNLTRYTKQKKSPFWVFQRLQAARMTVCVTNKNPTNNPLVSSKTFFSVPRGQSGVMGVSVCLCIWYELHTLNNLICRETVTLYYAVYCLHIGSFLFWRHL